MGYSLVIVILAVLIFFIMISARKQRQNYWKVKKRIKDRVLHRDR